MSLDIAVMGKPELPHCLRHFAAANHLLTSNGLLFQHAVGHCGHVQTRFSELFAPLCCCPLLLSLTLARAFVADSLEPPARNLTEVLH